MGFKKLEADFGRGAWSEFFHCSHCSNGNKGDHEVLFRVRHFSKSFQKMSFWIQIVKVGSIVKALL